MNTFSGKDRTNTGIGRAIADRLALVKPACGSLAISALAGTALLVAALSLPGCASSSAEPSTSSEPRVFESGFESAEDFSPFYVVPSLAYGSDHALVETDTRGDLEVVPRDGTSMHKAFIIAVNDDNNDSSRGYRPHRAYPTVQFHKTDGGVIRGPSLTTFMVWLDVELLDMPEGSIDDWFSLATLTTDSSDDWRRTVLANVGPDGLLHLMHVPDQGKQEYLYQSDSVRFPLRTWVRIDLYVDFSKTNGYAELWQDGTTVSSARVNGGTGALAQAHFGLYASARVPSGVVYNDSLRIRGVSGIDEARALVMAENR